MNKAREEILELITGAEKRAGVPRDVLTKIYELEESVVHMRVRSGVEQGIQDIIAGIIKSSYDLDQYPTQQLQPSDI